MKTLLLSLVLSLGLGTGAASAQADTQVAVDQPAVQYMMVDPGGH